MHSHFRLVGLFSFCLCTLLFLHPVARDAARRRRGLAARVAHLRRQHLSHALARRRPHCEQTRGAELLPRRAAVGACHWRRRRCKGQQLWRVVCQCRRIILAFVVFAQLSLVVVVVVVVVVRRVCERARVGGQSLVRRLQFPRRLAARARRSLFHRVQRRAGAAGAACGMQPYPLLLRHCLGDFPDLPTLSLSSYLRHALCLSHSLF